MLPEHCDYWPVRPGVTGRRAAWFAQVPPCEASANDFVCTRLRHHQLPHVAWGVTQVTAVWDDVWYADDIISCPTREVT